VLRDCSRACRLLEDLDRGLGNGGRTNSWTQPHVLRMADAGDVNTLNPHLGQFADVGYVAQMTMAWLVRWDENNNPIPSSLPRFRLKRTGRQ